MADTSVKSANGLSAGRRLAQGNTVNQGFQGRFPLACHLPSLLHHRYELY